MALNHLLSLCFVAVSSGHFVLIELLRLVALKFSLNLENRSHCFFTLLLPHSQGPQTLSVRCLKLSRAPRGSFTFFCLLSSHFIASVSILKFKTFRSATPKLWLIPPNVLFTRDSRFHCRNSVSVLVMSSRSPLKKPDPSLPEHAVYGSETDFKVHTLQVHRRHF